MEEKMKVQFSSIDMELSDLDHMAGLCFRSIKFRLINALLGGRLRREGIWEDLTQEIYTAAWEAFQQEMNGKEALRLTGRRVDAFLKAYGFNHNGGRREEFLPQEDWEGLAANQVQEDGDDGVEPEPAKLPRHKLLNKEMSIEEKILTIVRENRQGISKADLYRRLQISAQELDYHLAPLTMRCEIIEVKRQNTIGRYPTPLVFIGTAKIPEEMLAVTDKKEQIRRAYFEEGKSIKRITKEYHCSKKTVHRVVTGA